MEKELMEGRKTKKAVMAVLLLAIMIGLVGCGSTNASGAASDSKQADTPAVSERVQDAPDASAEQKQDDAAAQTPESGNVAVYPNATDLTEVAMGVTEDLCTVKVPLDYVLIGGYYDEDGNEHSIDGLDSATTTVQEAMDAGGFSTGKNIAAFTATSVDGDTTMVTATMYQASLMSWDDFKTTYPEAAEIGTADVPALAYHVDAFSGKSLAVAVKVSNEITLSLVYEGPSEEQYGTEALAQALYELVTVK